MRREVPSSEVWNHFSSAEHRQAGITKRAEALIDINSHQHVTGLSQQIMEQQAKVDYMIENADFPVSEGGKTNEYILNEQRIYKYNLSRNTPSSKSYRRGFLHPFGWGGLVYPQPHAVPLCETFNRISPYA
ncbi:hypothetical protein ACT7DL_17760 [Bacillus paranthracis]